MAKQPPELAVDTVLLIGSIYLATFANTAFWRAVLAGRALDDIRTWPFAAAIMVILTCVHFLAMAPFCTRRTVRTLLVALGVVAAAANYFMQHYGVVLDTSMLRNVVHTDSREAAELINADTLAAVAIGAVPLTLLWRVRLKVQSRWRALGRRIVAMSIALIAAAGALLLIFQDISSMIRTHRTLRYTINPASLIWSFGRVLADDANVAGAERDRPDPVHRTERAMQGKPVLMVIVVGETARAANFSLNGYARSTNPELSRLDVVNFARVQACGTSTEASLPCMFSPFGRADYDAARIRRHESLLHVLSRADFRVVWLDNQSGCKGVCDGLEYRNLSRSTLPALCGNQRCYDEILSQELARVTERADGDLVVVLHQLGNHGPAYFRRYPEAFKRFTPACERDELRECSVQEIVNAYDNAILYTDRFLSGVIALLDSMRARFDVVMVYASDHGESLGEKGLFLHGLPYGIAPREQLHVPMLWWIPRQSAQRFGIDVECLRSKSASNASHDNLYHSIMGLLRVDTPRYRRERDLFADCRGTRQATALGPPLSKSPGLQRIARPFRKISMRSHS